MAPRGAQAARARRFHELHRAARPLVLLNAWDAGSARAFAAFGAPAIATTSGGIAFALGRPDGEQLTREELVDATARVAAAVELPVSADVEGGYGATPEEVGDTIAAIVAAGAVGVNVEDAAPAGADPPLRSLDEQCARLAAARAAADDAGVPLFLNARTDVCLLGVGAPGAERLALAVERVRAFAEAGADGVFVPGLSDPAEIAEVVAAVDLPLNLLASAALPPVPELARLGVARVSVGSGPMRAMLTLLRSIADELHERGTYELLTGGVLSYDDANRLFG